MSMRELVVTDAPALQALLRRIYGDTYSYRSLYQPDGLGDLLAHGRASLWGDFDDPGELLSHTGFFWKDPRADYVESGLSLRHPSVRPGVSDRDVWTRLFAWLGDRVGYVHQQTTTTHPLAQRYAERHIRARPVGFVIDYAVGEQLSMVARTGPMHALMMTTVVGDRHARPEIALPDGPWCEFLQLAARNIGLVPTTATADHSGRAPTIDTAAIEHNRDLQLKRRSVARGGTGIALAAAADARVDLIHVPTDERVTAVPALVAAGWVPMGIRAHRSRPHELVLQYLPGDRTNYATTGLANARLGASARDLATAWTIGCTRAL